MFKKVSGFMMFLFVALMSAVAHADVYADAATALGTAATSAGTLLVAALAIPLAFLAFKVARRGINKA